MDLLRHLGLADELFTREVATIHEAVARGDALLVSIVSVLTGCKPDSRTRDLLDRCYDYLSEEDVPKPSDLIFVFGGKTPARPERAAQLYAKGLAPRMMMSGGNAIYAQHKDKTEAEIYRDIAIGSGVPVEAIIVESTSITVPDNVRVSLNLLDEMGIQVDSFTLVNSPYTQRRGWALFKKHVPDKVTLYRVNCDTKPEFSRDQWYQQENTMRVVLSEFMKMRASVVYNTA